MASRVSAVLEDVEYSYWVEDGTLLGQVGDTPPFLVSEDCDLDGLSLSLGPGAVELEYTVAAEPVTLTSSDGMNFTKMGA